MAAAEDAVGVATATLDNARDQYEEVSARVVREFARFRRDKAADMKKIILDYVNVQVGRGGRRRGVNVRAYHFFFFFLGR